MAESFPAHSHQGTWLTQKYSTWLKSGCGLRWERPARGQRPHLVHLCTASSRMDSGHLKSQGFRGVFFLGRRGEANHLERKSGFCEDLPCSSSRSCLPWLLPEKWKAPSRTECPLTLSLGTSSPHALLPGESTIFPTRPSRLYVCAWLAGRLQETVGGGLLPTHTRPTPGDAAPGRARLQAVKLGQKPCSLLDSLLGTASPL